MKYYNLSTNSFCDVRRADTDIEMTDESVTAMFSQAESENKVIATKNRQATLMTIAEFEVLKNGY